MSEFTKHALYNAGTRVLEMVGRFPPETVAGHLVREVDYAYAGVPGMVTLNAAGDGDDPILPPPPQPIPGLDAELAKAQLDNVQLYLKAVLFVVLDAVNDERMRAGLVAITPVQFLDAMKAKVDELA